MCGGLFAGEAACAVLQDDFMPSLGAVFLGLLELTESFMLFLLEDLLAGLTPLREKGRGRPLVSGRCTMTQGRITVN